MIRPLLGLTALLIAIIDGGKMAQAQPVDFKCPQAGVVEIRLPFKIQYTGSSGISHYICNVIDGLCKKRSLLFNITAVHDADRQATHDAFITLLPVREKIVSHDKK